MAPQAGNLAGIIITDRKESPYGTAVLDANITDFFAIAEAPFPAHEPTFRTDDGAASLDFPRLNDLDRILTRQELSWGTTGGYFLAGWMAAFGMGNISTTGSVDPFTHVNIPFDRTTGLQIPSTSALLRLFGTTDRKLIKGLAVSSWSIEISRPDPSATMNISLVGDGSITVSTKTFPVVGTEDKIPIWDDLDVQLGPEGAPVSIKERIRSARFEWTNPILEDVAHDPGGGVNAARMIMGTGQRATMTLTIEHDGTTTNEARLRSQVNLESFMEFNDGADRQAKYLFNRCRVSAYGQGNDNGVATEELTLMPLDNGTDDYVTVTIKNAQASYLT